MTEIARDVGKGALKRLPYALAGAGLFGAGTYASTQMSNDPLRKKVDELQAIPDRSLGEAGDLAQNQARLALADYGEKHPARASLMVALTGAGLGATAGPGLASTLGEHRKELGLIANAVKRIAAVR